MQVIRGDQTTIDYSLYGWDRSDTSYFENNLKRVADVIKDKSSAVYDNIVNVYNRYHDSDIIRRAKSVLRRSGSGVRDENVITRYNDPRRANRRMREFVMAHDKVYDMYTRGILDGYSDTDYVLDKILNRANHALATNGVYQEEGVCTRYWIVDGIDIEEDRLELDEQVEIELTWNNISKFINEDIDPTNKI